MMRLYRAFGAMATGFAVGQKFSEGERLKALAIGVGLAFPLIVKRRIGSLALAAAIAFGAYYLFEQVHTQQLPDELVPADASVN